MLKMLAFVFRWKVEGIDMQPTVVWRCPVKHGKLTPLVVLLHGRGADEHDLIDLANDLPQHFAYASVRGPIALPEGGYRWFEDRGVGRPVPSSLQSTVHMLRTWIDSSAMAEYDRKRTFVLGFSQGMMTAAALLLDDPSRLAGAVLLSGSIAVDNGTATPERLVGVPVFTAHGTLDGVIPPDRVEQSLQYLRERSGAELSEHTYPIDHAISRREIADISAWLAERG
jgi:phospholipase/carboxylesterase